jgi:hypothetical protein
MRTEADVSLRGQVRLPGGPAAVLKAPALQGAASVAGDLRPDVQALDPDELFDQLLEPALTNPAIRGDLRNFAGDTREGRRQLVKANPRLSGLAKLKDLAGHY